MIGVMGEKGEARAPTLVESLRQSTQTLHLEAERSGFIRQLLRGHGNREGYVLLIRSLQPVYDALERGITENRTLPLVQAIYDDRLWRSGALVADLKHLAGSRWEQDVSALPAGERYAQRIRHLSSAKPELLVAHAYVRYLGDLSGGQILRRLLARSLGLGDAELSFYAFARIEDVDSFKARYLAGLNDAARGADTAGIAEEARLVFGLNIELSEAVLGRIGSAVVA